MLLSSRWRLARHNCLSYYWHHLSTSAISTLLSSSPSSLSGRNVRRPGRSLMRAVPSAALFGTVSERGTTGLRVNSALSSMIERWRNDNQGDTMQWHEMPLFVCAGDGELGDADARVVETLRQRFTAEENMTTEVETRIMKMLSEIRMPHQDSHRYDPKLRHKRGRNYDAVDTEEDAAVKREMLENVCMLFESMIGEQKKRREWYTKQLHICASETEGASQSFAVAHAELERLVKSIPLHPNHQVWTALIFSVGIVEGVDPMMMLFARMKSTPGLAITEVTYNSIIKVLCENKQFDVADQVWAELDRRPDISAQAITYLSAISSASWSGDAVRVRKLLQRLLFSGHVGGMLGRQWRSIVNSLARVGATENVWSLYMRFEDKFSENVRLCTAVISALAAPMMKHSSRGRCNSVVSPSVLQNLQERIEYILNKLTEHDVPFDSVLNRLRIRIYGQVFHDANAMMRLFDDIVRDNAQFSRRDMCMMMTHVVQNIVSMSLSRSDFRESVKALRAKAEQPKSSHNQYVMLRDLLRNLYRRARTTDAIDYVLRSTFLGAFGRVGDLPGAVRVWNDMVEDCMMRQDSLGSGGIDAISFTHMLRAFAVYGSSDVCVQIASHLSTLHNRGDDQNLHHLATLISSFGKAEARVRILDDADADIAGNVSFRLLLPMRTDTGDTDDIRSIDVISLPIRFVWGEQSFSAEEAHTRVQHALHIFQDGITSYAASAAASVPDGGGERSGGRGRGRSGGESESTGAGNRNIERHDRHHGDKDVLITSTWNAMIKVAAEFQQFDVMMDVYDTMGRGSAPHADSTTFITLFSHLGGNKQRKHVQRLYEDWLLRARETSPPQLAQAVLMALGQCRLIEPLWDEYMYFESSFHRPQIHRAVLNFLCEAGRIDPSPEINTRVSHVIDTMLSSTRTVVPTLLNMRHVLNYTATYATTQFRDSAEAMSANANPATVLEHVLSAFETLASRMIDPWSGAVLRTLVHTISRLAGAMRSSHSQFAGQLADKLRIFSAHVDDPKSTSISRKDSYVKSLRALAVRS